MDNWLLDGRLMEASVKLSACIVQMQQCEQWNDDMDRLWRNLQLVETAQMAMADAIGLTKLRREAGASCAELTGKWQKLSDELVLHLQHVQKNWQCSA